MEYRYKTVTDLKAAIDAGEVDPKQLDAFNNKYELFIHGPAMKEGESYSRIFNAYYGTNNGCNDVCALLGIGEPERV